MIKGKVFALGLGLAVAMGMTVGPTAALANDVKKGEKVFKKRCKSCHTVKKDKHKVGPSLFGIYGSQAGTTTFKKYKGLKDSDLVWNEENLDGWIKDPKKFLGKRTTMTFKLKKAQDRADVIAYLKTVK